MKVGYYPGCSLKNSYPEFEKSTIESCRELGIELEEVPEWNCCGVNFSLSDNIMRHLGAVRTFLNVQEEMGDVGNKIVTLCSMCYNVLKRVNVTLKEERDTLENINEFIEDFPDYRAELEIVHILQLLKEEIGFDTLKKKVKNPLEGVKIAPYYGCALLRPDSVSIDSTENPKILEQFIESLGGEVVEFPFKIECCGNYHAAFRKNIVETRSRRIVDSALSAGADMLISPCPLCTYNLRLGAETAGKEIPILFFSQILALSLDVEPHLSSEIKKTGFMKTFMEASHA